MAIAHRNKCNLSFTLTKGMEDVQGKPNVYHIQY